MVAHIWTLCTRCLCRSSDVGWSLHPNFSNLLLVGFLWIPVRVTPFGRLFKSTGRGWRSQNSKNPGIAKGGEGAKGPEGTFRPFGPAGALRIGACCYIEMATAQCAPPAQWIRTRRRVKTDFRRKTGRSRAVHHHCVIKKKLFRAGSSAAETCCKLNVNFSMGNHRRAPV